MLPASVPKVYFRREFPGKYRNSKAIIRSMKLRLFRYAGQRASNSTYPRIVAESLLEDTQSSKAKRLPR